MIIVKKEKSPGEKNCVTDLVPPRGFQGQGSPFIPHSERIPIDVHFPSRNISDPIFFIPIDPIKSKLCKSKTIQILRHLSSEFEIFK